MIIFGIETLIIIILGMIFSTLIIDEKRRRQKEMHVVKLKGYWDGSERRSVDRLNAALEVKYFANGTPNHAQSVDISTKGIKLLLDERIEQGTPLRLEIKLPAENRFIKAHGEVAWIKESVEDEQGSPKRLFNTGIKFSKFKNADEKRLFDFINSLET